MTTMMEAFLHSDGLLRDLRTYRLSEEDEKTVAAIERKLTEPDRDGIVRPAEDK